MGFYNFIDSNLFQTIIIFITGIVALMIYYINKYNEKKDAARIIINEIRIAERAIQEIRNRKIVSELLIILPNDTWQYKKHLFLNNLDQDEINLINDFYYKCAYAEQYRRMVYNIRNDAIISKSNYLQNKLIDVMYDSINSSEKDYEDIKQKIIAMANSENWLFEPNTPLVNLIEYIENIIFITSTNAGDKLKNIAK
jgi:hypothetical protein